MKMRGAKAMLESLKREGVEVMFGIPGATVLVTGIATAFLDSSPIVAFTGQVPRAMIGKDAFQEADSMGITMPITKHNFQFYSVEEIPHIIKKAFKIARTGRPGPVLIDVPKDVQEKEGVMKFAEEVEIVGYNPTLRGHPKQVKKAVDLLMSAERPIALVGGGVIISGASAELLALVEMLQIPVVTSLMGKGGFPESHPLALGMIGMHGRKAGNYAITESDVVL